MSSSSPDTQLFRVFDRVAALCHTAELSNTAHGWRVYLVPPSGDSIEVTSPRLLDAIALAVDAAQRRGWLRPDQN